MIDKTLVSIISMIFGGVGFVGAITKYEFPNARKTTYGMNLFLLKEDIVNSVVTWIFTVYAMLGLVIQIFLGEIVELEERHYSVSFYLVALLIALLIIASLIPMLRKMSKWIARDYWLPVVASKAKENFLLAKSLVEEKDQIDDTNASSQVTKIVDWLEELFEMKSEKRDLVSRLIYFEGIFKT